MSINIVPKLSNCWLIIIKMIASSVSPSPKAASKIVPAPPAPPVEIIFPKECLFVHKVPETPYSQSAQDVITLGENFRSSVPEGTTVMIGRNRFILVSIFQKDIVVPEAKKTLELPPGTTINYRGIPLKTAGILNLSIPTKCSIRIPAKTRLQQSDSPVRLILDEETEAIILD